MNDKDPNDKDTNDKDPNDKDPLVRLLSEPGPWTFAYIDGHSDQPEPSEIGRRRSVADRLREAGAPDADVAAVAQAVNAGEGLPFPSTRFLLVRDGAVALDERFASARLGPELLGHGSLPPVLPLLRHRAAEIRYLVVETGREGARLWLERSRRAGDEEVTEIEGATDSLPKVQAGGWSHKRYQSHSEQTWKHNQAEVAEAVDRLVRELHPRFVAVAGDVRARQLLEDQLAPISRELVVDVDAHTRADGADDRALDDAIAAVIAEQLRSDAGEALERAFMDGGAEGARGIADVVGALQQARVDTLLLDPRMVDADDTLLALDAPPWVAEGEGYSLPAGIVAAAPAPEALARAALLSGARVMVAERESAEDPPHEEPAAEPIAVLRWGREGT